MHHQKVNMKRGIHIVLVMLMLQQTATAQLIRPVTVNNEFSNKLSQVTGGIRNNFHSVQGEKLPSGEDVDVYGSLVTLPGAKHCTISRYHSVEDTSASWQAMMYEGDIYEQALKVYKKTCREVNKTVVKLDNGTAASFKGKTENPEQNLRFVTSSYRLNTKDPFYKNYYAEVEMVNINFDQWEVRVNLLCKKEDPDEE